MPIGDLEAGFSQDASGDTKVTITDGGGSGNNVTVTTINSKQRLDVNLPSEGQADSAAPFDTTQVGGTDGTNLRAIATDTSGNQKIVGSVASATSDSGNPVKTGAIFNSTLPTITNGQRVDSQADANGRHIVLSVPSDGYKATYNATATFVAASTATDFFTLTGSATKTIRIIRIGMSATQTTSAEVNLILLKRSTANSGGTSTSPTIVPNDSGDAAGTAVARAYTANPTSLGSLVGNLRNFKLTVPVIAVGGNATAPIEQIEYFGDKFGKGLVLRGTGEVFALNLNSATVTGNNFSVWIEWTEE